MYKITKDASTHGLRFDGVPHGISLKSKGDVVAGYFAKLKALFEKLVVHENNTDELIERMAFAVPNDVPKEVVNLVPDTLERLKGMIETINKTLVKCSSVKDEEKEKTLEGIGASTDIAVVVKKLTADRVDKRNKSMISQYVEKNVGSVGASEMPQMIDTVFKGKRILSVMEQLGVPLKDKDTVVHLYGVAYGHMEKVSSTYPCKFMYYDRKAAVRSSATMKYGNIWDFDGEYLLDDSLPTDIEDAELAKLAGKNYTATHAKVSKIISSRVKVAIIKLDMANLNSDARIAALTNMVYQSRFGFSQIVKFGKVHNAEAFLILHAEKKRKNALASDIKQVCMIMSVANIIITAAHERGVRLTKLMGIDLCSLWSNLIKAMPISWKWYLAPVKGIQGGAYYAKMEAVEDGTYSQGFEYNYDDDAVALGVDPAPVQ